MFTRNLADKGGQAWHRGWLENQLLFVLTGGEKNGKNEERKNKKLNSTSGRVTWVMTL